MGIEHWAWENHHYLNYQLPITNYQLPITHYPLPITDPKIKYPHNWLVT
ncbi:hypothetical protein [Fischerella thermalis]